MPNDYCHHDKDFHVLDVILKLIATISQIWASLSDDQKESICTAITELMDKIFREYFRANTGGAQ